MEKRKNVLVLNPGSTSTKIALYSNMEEVVTINYTHDKDELKRFEGYLDQVPFRAEVLRKFLKENNLTHEDIDLIVPRYPQFKSRYPGHVMSNKEMINVCNKAEGAFHIMCVSPLMADSVLPEVPMAVCDVMAYIEPPEVLTLTGIPGVKRAEKCHVENTMQISRKLADQEGKSVEDLNIIVAHMGGGVSFNWVNKGKVRYCMFDGEGAFSPERGGMIPALQLINMCFSGEYTKKEITDLIKGKGGLVAYLGTNDCRVVEKIIAQGDEKAKLVYEAMIIRMAAAIGEVNAIAGGVDEIIFTGGIAHSVYATRILEEHIGMLAPIRKMPGEYEMEFFAQFGTDVLDQKVKITNFEVPI